GLRFQNGGNVTDATNMVQAGEAALDAVEEDEVPRVIHNSVQSLEDRSRRGLVKDEIGLLRNGGELQCARLEGDFPLLDEQRRHAPEEEQCRRKGRPHVAWADERQRERTNARHPIQREEQSREKDRGGNGSDQEAEDLVDVGVAPAPKEQKAVLEILLAPAQADRGQGR